MDDTLEDEVRGSDECGVNVDNSEINVENMRIEGESCELIEEVESDEGRKNFIYNPQVADHLKPSVEKKFQTIDEVKDFYNAYAKEAGFSIRSWATKKIKGSDEVKRKEYVCFKQGKRITIADVETKRRRGSIKESCKAMVAVLKINSGEYVVSQFIEGHSHPLATPSKKHLLRSHRSVSSAQKCLTQQLAMINIPSHQQFNFLGVQAGGFENVGCTQKDLYNYERDRRNELKGHDGEMLSEFCKLEKGKNPSFTYEIKVDNEQRITHCFWADATSRRAYSFYGDVVVFDTTYNTNRYGLIFAPLMGVNKHGQTIIFACAFLSDETSNSFVWLFNQFLEAMPGEAPKMIITDQDPAMSKAILETLPDTFHRYCSWHILTKFSEKLDLVKYNAHYNEFSDCIWNSESKKEFDLTWTELVGRSGLHDNKWLQTMYKIRSNWVPAYCNHVFSANMSSSQRAESSHSFFKRYISKNNSLVDFMIQFSRGLVRQRQEELLADHKDLIEKPKVKINHDFLFQMVDIYTREMFYKFEDEMWECLNYRFELIKDSDNQCVFQVHRKKMFTRRVRELIYDKKLGHASCSCHKFESMGIPCRHVLGYLIKMHDFEELPQQYILKRWTKKTNSRVVVDNESGIMINSDKEYLTKRSELIQYSSDVIDKALTSQEGINIYKDALAHALESINLVVDSGKSSQCGIGVNVVSGKMSCNKDYIYNEPNLVRAKGCGKRLKGGKERALKKAKNSKARRCHGCGKIGQSHDKRNCPMVAHRDSPDNEDATTFSSSEDDSHTSKGSEMLATIGCY